MNRFVSACLLLAACGDSGGTVDAQTYFDARPDVAIDAPFVFNCATAPTVGSHKLFLQFDGATLTRGPSDAVMNRFAGLSGGVTSVGIPPWRANAPDRAAQIQAVVCNVRESLFSFDVEVVTTRPTFGDFEMIVFGGSYTDLGYSPSPGTFIVSLTIQDCNSASQRDVAWVTEHPSGTDLMTTLETSNYAVSALGQNNGLGSSKSTSNCMCNLFAGDFLNCPNTEVCKFSMTSEFRANGGNVCSRSGATENQVVRLISMYGTRQ
jgi:hypothetical protein